MFARCFAIVLLTATSATFCDRVHAEWETILVDFGDVRSAPTLGGTWNEIAAPSSTPQNLVDASNSVTSVKLACTGFFRATTSGQTRWNADKSWVDADATADYFYIHDSDHLAGTVIFDGLDDTLRYNLEVVSSRQQPSTSNHDIVDITVQDEYITNEADSDDFDCHEGFNNKTILIWENVASVDGQIALALVAQDSSGYDFLNAACLSTVPEPASSMLLLGGIFVVSLWTLGQRVRRRLPD